LVAGLYNGLVV
jgi:dynein intermediate chain 2